MKISENDKNWQAFCRDSEMTEKELKAFKDFLEDFHNTPCDEWLDNFDSYSEPYDYTNF